MGVIELCSVEGHVAVEPYGSEFESWLHHNLPTVTVGKLFNLFGLHQLIYKIKIIVVPICTYITYSIYSTYLYL